jgi:type II secretory ATPase GspE/PulE/Tfp pilus assembly ATPase PilB-like protein
MGHLQSCETFYHGRGCSKCRFTGFHGRTVVTELLLMTDIIREMTISRAHSNQVDAQARKDGMTSLFHSGLEKVHQGITTYEEILRITKGTIVD